MKILGSILMVLVTAGLVVLGLAQTGRSGTSVGADSGAALLVAKSESNTPTQAASNLFIAVRGRDWNSAYSQLANPADVPQAQFTKEMAGGDGSLRSLSTLAAWDLKPLHESGTEAQMRAVLHWSTAVGPMDDVHDLKFLRSGDTWKVAWPAARQVDAPGQVIAVNYLRWDLVTPPSKADGWAGQNIDAPRVRILSMNAIAYQGGTIVMGEVVNEDTIPAFVNVNAVLIGAAGESIDEESSFDKIAHVLLPKQVSPYRIDFRAVGLQEVKNVHMDLHVTLVPASADPVIGVMEQKQGKDALGKPVLTGSLFNESGQTVNVPHVIVSFYDNAGKVIWVSDGYVPHALHPQTPEPFTVDIPAQIAPLVKNYHVVVNQYSIGKS
jgi:hypothetical protein